jgi:hypothetical protein
MCWPRCATPRTLSSSSPLLSIAIAVVFLTGAALFGLGTVTRRKQAKSSGESGRITWPVLVDDTLSAVDLDQRIEMISRLAIVRSAWARDVLVRAQREETDPRAKAALEQALSGELSP